ncbi:MAG: type II toxin-antitoxin system RelE/ParE family toxin [Nitrospirae bacterium]|nr:type II toxin-antitoxin system RelE/ParE family toxin [Nitrospirota bacterium]
MAPLLHALPTAARQSILDEISARLSTNPVRESKTRIKRMTGFIPPLYRLRVGDYRVYYRVHAPTVAILAVLQKKDSDRWLKKNP